MILVLSALLVGPYLVDWNNQRDWLAARLSHAFGARVQIAGPVEVRLLPTPIFRAGGISMQGKSPQEPRLLADHLDAELSLNGLMRGAVEFVEAHLAAPQLAVTLRDDGTLVLPATDVDNPQRFQFTHASVDDGTLIIRDEAGRERLALDGISAQGDADSLVGPLKLSGTASGSQGRVNFRFSTGTYAARKLRVHLVIDGDPQVSHADLDGQITVGAATASGHAPLAFEGAATLAGTLRVADGASPVPWSVALASLKGDATSISAGAVELRAGYEGRAVVANGPAVLDLGAVPVLAAQLRARQLDLDRISVPPDVAPDTPRPTAGQWSAALQVLLADTRPLAVRLSLLATVDAVTRADLTLTDAVLAVDAGPSTPPRVKVSMVGPNGTRVALDGMVDRGAAPGFKGQAEFATHDLSTATGWIDPFWPGLADAVAAATHVSDLSVKGQVDLSRVGASIRDLALTADGAAFGGTVSLTAGGGSERPRLSADLTADKLDLDRLPALDGIVPTLRALDLSVTLAAKAVEIGPAGLAAGHLALRLSKTGDEVRLDQLAIAGLEGAAVSATGSLDATGQVRSQGHVTAVNARPLVSLLQRLLPGAGLDGIATHSDGLSPLDLDVTLDGTLSAATGLAPSHIVGKGTLGAAEVDLSVTPEATQGTAGPLLAAHGVIAAADGAALLRQWGMAGLAIPFGPARVELSGRGRLETGFDGQVVATLADSGLKFVGHAAADTGHGSVTGQSGNAGSLLKLFSLPASFAALPWSFATEASWADGRLDAKTLTARVGSATVSGALAYVYRPGDPATTAPALTGTLATEALAASDMTALLLGPTGSATAGWSKAKFDAAPSWPRTDVALSLRALGLASPFVLRDAKLRLKLAPGSLTLQDLTGRLLDGSAQGSLTLRRDGPSASLSGQIGMDAVSVALPSLAGKLNLGASVAATGTSLDALVGSLAGDGTVTLKGARMPRLNPGALGGTAKAFDVEGATVDDAAIRDTLGKALDQGALTLGDLSAQATLAAGTLRVTGLTTRMADYGAVTDATFNLRDTTLLLRTVVTATDRPKDWKGEPPQVTVTWSGPPLTPNRDIDAAAFVNGLAARAIARDQERIELMQDDLRERAFFARRLRAIEAEQEAARAAAVIQKMAPEPPRPGNIRAPKPPEMPPVRPVDVSGKPKSIDDILRSSNIPPPEPPGPIDIRPQSTRP